MYSINISNNPNFPTDIIYRSVSVKIQPIYSNNQHEFTPIAVDVVCKVNSWKDAERSVLFSDIKKSVTLRITNETTVDNRDGNYVDLTLSEGDAGYVNPTYHTGELDFFFSQEEYSINQMITIGVQRADSVGRFDS